MKELDTYFPTTVGVSWKSGTSSKGLSAFFRGEGDVTVGEDEKNRMGGLVFIERRRDYDLLYVLMNLTRFYVSLYRGLRQERSTILRTVQVGSPYVEG